jgi:hypothetical protein
MKIHAVTAFIVMLGSLALAQAPRGGIGVQVAPDAGGLRIGSVAPGGPADRAGLQAGDLIVSVDDRPVAFMDPAAAVAMITGPIGTSVRLMVASPNGSGRTVTLQRAGVAQGPAPANAPQAGAQPAPPPARMTAPAALAAGQEAAAPVDLIPWVEPRERAFSLMVPKGWNVTGGLNWTGPIDPQPFVQVQSPDRRAQIYLGDPEILPRMVPNQWSTMQTGAREGGKFQSPSGGPALLQRFMTGTQFAKAHVAERICRDAQWLREVDLPELSQQTTKALAPEAARLGGTANASAGEAGFSCNNGIGFVTATTYLAGSNRAPIQAWGVLRVGVFMSTDQSQAILARYVLESMLSTFKLDPSWQQQWERRVAQVTGGVISTQNAATQQALQSARNASDTLARLNRPNEGVATRRDAKVGDIIRNERHVCDAIGRCETVSRDHETVWIDHSGRTAAGRAGGAPPDNSGVWAIMK